MEYAVIPWSGEQSFPESVKTVHKVMCGIKDALPGTASAAGMEQLAKAPLPAVERMYAGLHETVRASGMTLPQLTNLGTLDELAGRFGSMGVQDCHLVAPIMRSPFICVGANSFQERLTLTIGFHAPAVAEERVQRLLGDMMDLLCLDKT